MTPGTFAAGALVRLLLLVSLAALIGGLTLGALIPLDDRADAGVARDVRRWTVLAVLALVVASIAELVVRADTLAGAGVAGSLRVIPVVVTHTHFGQIWTVRVVTLVALAVMLRVRGAVVVTAVLALGIVGTIVITGHAGDWGDLSVSVVVDAAHALASTAWIGGLCALTVVVIPRWILRREQRLAVVLTRFSRLAATSLAIVILSGIYNGWVQLGSWPAVWSTPYGRALLAKLCLAGVLVWLGAVNRYVLLPRLHGSAPRTIAQRLAGGLARRVRRAEPRRPAAVSLRRSIAWEVVVAILVLACTALLAEMTPGRHAAHLQAPAHEHSE